LSKLSGVERIQAPKEKEVSGLESATGTNSG
jgi:hypothetical protein